MERSPRLVYELGAYSRDRTDEAVEALSPEAKYLRLVVHLDSLPPRLRREIARWQRRMLLASVKGRDPSVVKPPATMRTALLEAFIESEDKLLLSDAVLRERGVDIGSEEEEE